MNKSGRGDRKFPPGKKPAVPAGRSARSARSSRTSLPGISTLPCGPIPGLFLKAGAAYRRLGVMHATRETGAEPPPGPADAPGTARRWLAVGGSTAADSRVAGEDAARD